MANNVDKLLSVIPDSKDVQFLPVLALRSVTSKSGHGVYASSDTLYKGAIFGRDSLEVAEDFVDIKQRLVRSIIRTLVILQGQVIDTKSEEEPGKIIHEYRSTVVDGKPIDDISMSIFKTLSHKWGGNDQEFAYYGSIDSTPHFLRTLGLYCRVNDHKILHETVVQRRGQSVTILEAARRSTIWLIEKLNSSHSGLLEYKRSNPHGILNQVWKDSDEFYVHENKQRANHNFPIASIEVQGLVYDGLTEAAKLLPDLKDQCSVAASKVREKTIKLLWQEDRKYFGLGIDYGEDSKIRQIATATANPAALLDSGFFDEIEHVEKQKYISGIVEQIMSDNFLTDAGIRSRALSESNLVDHWDYHGSYVSWPKETFDIAKGLHRQGFPILARQLENRMLNVCLKFRGYPEFVYVDADGRVLAKAPSSHSHGELMLVEGTNQPERIQAWTVSAVVSLLSVRLKNKIPLKLRTTKSKLWQKNLEKKLVEQIPIVDRHINPFTLAARYPTYNYRLRDKDE